MIRKVVIIGPESTGKSTLCTQLANHFKTCWVPEYAREYLIREGTDYSYDDLLHIAKQQLALEEEYTNRADNGIVFIDTDMYVMKIWCEFVFGRCHQWILDRIAEKTYDLYLLCNPDLPWVKDKLREYPDLASRQQLFHMYKDHMVNQHVRWKEVKGPYEERIRFSIAAVNDLRAH